MLRSVCFLYDPVCVCVCVGGGVYLWGLFYLGDTSESSLLPEGPVKMQSSLC